MSAPVNKRVQKRREALRASSLRPVQMWLPDTRAPGFAAECRRQVLVAAASDREDQEMLDFLDAALVDLLAGEE